MNSPINILNRKYPDLDFRFRIDAFNGEEVYVHQFSNYVKKAIHCNLDIQDIIDCVNIEYNRLNVSVVDAPLNSIIYDGELEVDIIMINSYTVNPIKMKNVVYNNGSIFRMSNLCKNSFSEIQKEYMRNVSL